MAVPYTFGTATASIPLSNLDSNFATTITLGNTAVQLGNTVTTLNNMTLANVTVSSGNVTFTNVSATTANVTTANITTAVIGTATITTAGITTANVTTANIVTAVITTANVTTANVSTALSYSGTLTGGTGIVNLGSGQFYKDASGNVGIGTASPDSKLVIEGGSGTYAQIKDGTVTAFVQARSANSTGVVGTLSNHALAFWTNSAERARIDTSGNMGIGTSSPATALEINGSGTAGNFLLNVNAGTYGKASDTSIEMATSADATPRMLFRVGSASERMRIDSSGNLLVGTTSASPFQDNNSFIVRAVGDIIQNHVTGTGSGSAYISFGYAGSGIGSITQSGTTAVLYNVTSDQRLKENIQDAASASALIDSLQVRQFDWKTDNTHQRYGFIAQELVTVAPEAVHQPADPEEMMAVDYSKLVPMLVKEIQSLRIRLAALEAA